MDHPKKNVVEWFFGYGGNHIGLGLAGVDMRILALCEIEEYAILNILEKMEEGRLPVAPIWTDCKTFPREPFKNCVDIFVASYPCQPFSSAGKRLGKDDPRHLWPYVYEFVRDVRPKQCFFENVEGHVTKGLQEVIEDLEGIGYEVSWGIFSAEEVGAPHRRKRVFILANSNSESGSGSSERRIYDAKARSAGENVADADSQGPQGHGGLEQEHDKEGRKDQNGHAWPSRPGERQHEWEPPRTIDGKLNPDWVETLQGLPVGWTGKDNRIDRLRLLGNGVVPQTAALAWRTLCQKQL